MKIEAENSGPRQLFGFGEIPVYWGYGFEGFHCIVFVESNWSRRYAGFKLLYFKSEIVFPME